MLNRPDCIAIRAISYGMLGMSIFLTGESFLYPLIVGVI